MGRNNLFGFGGGLSPMWGAAIAPGVGTAVAIGARRMGAPGSKTQRYAEGIGLFAGLAASAGMWASGSMKEAGKVGFATTLATQGLRFLEGMVLGGGAVGWVTADPSGLGMPSVQALNGFGMPAANINDPHSYGAINSVAGGSASGYLAGAMGGAMAGPMVDNGQGAPISMLSQGGAGAGLASLFGHTHFR